MAWSQVQLHFNRPTAAPPHFRKSLWTSGWARGSTLWSSYVLPADTISHCCRKRCGGQAFLLLFLVLDGYRLVLLRLPEILAVRSHPTVHIWNRHKKSNQNRRLHTNSHHDPIKITCASPAASCLWASHFSFFLTLPFNPPATKEYNPKLMLPMALTAVLKTFLGNFKGFLLYYFISGMYIIYLGTQRKMIQSVNRPCLAGGFQSTLLSTPDTLNKVRSQCFERISNGQSCGFHWKCGRYPQHRNFDGKTIIHQILGNKRLLSDAECVWPPLCRCQTRPLYTLHTLEFVQMETPFEKSGRNLSSHPRVLDSNTDIVPVPRLWDWRKTWLTTGNTAVLCQLCEHRQPLSASTRTNILPIFQNSLESVAQWPTRSEALL